MSNYYNQYPQPPNPNFYGGMPTGGPPNPRKRRFDNSINNGGRVHPHPYQPHFQNHRNTYPNNARVSRFPVPSAELHPRSDTNLIINYLPQTFGDEEMRALFAPFGDIETCRIMRDRNTGYSFGYGFVNYGSSEAAALAIDSLNGIQVQNKVIKVSLARPPSTEIKDTNLYITNLPRETTEDELVNMFAPYGNIVQKNILYDKHTQLPRGVAFVRYDLREQANAAITAMNDFIPPGASEAIKVRLAENHGKQKANYLAGFQAGYSRTGRGGGAAGRF